MAILTTKKDVLHVVEIKGAHGRVAFKYRRTVPADCQPAIKGKNGKPIKNWIRTWKSGTPEATVEREAAILSARHDREISLARGETVTPEQIATAEAQARELLARDPADAMELLGFHLSQGHVSEADRLLSSALAHGGTYQPPSLKLSNAVKADCEKYSDGRDDRPLNFAVRSFIEIVSDKSIVEITRAEVSTWIVALRAGGPGRKPQAVATVKRRLAAIRAVVNRAYLDLEIERKNPFEKQKVNGGNGNGVAHDRLPFNREMIAKIDACLDGDNRLDHETRNLIRLIRNTGAGPGELGGLALADISLDGEVPYLWIRANSLRGLKNSKRDRKLPLIGVALDAAKDAVARVTGRLGRRSADAIPLFASFEMKRGADRLSAKMNLAIRKAGIPESPRLVAYSFRHTIKEAMRSAGVLNHIQDRIMGHAGEGAVSDRYGSPRARLSETQDALKKALKHLGDVDDSIYSEAERMK